MHATGRSVPASTSSFTVRFSSSYGASFNASDLSAALIATLAEHTPGVHFGEHSHRGITEFSTPYCGRPIFGLPQGQFRDRQARFPDPRFGKLVKGFARTLGAGSGVWLAVMPVLPSGCRPAP